MQLPKATACQFSRLVPAAIPDTLDYSNFRFRAEVDWVQLEIRTATPTNFWTVKARMGEKYAEALDADAGGAATKFLIKIQNPSCWEDVDARIQALTRDHPLRETPFVTAIEISLDAYRHTPNRQELAQMAGRFFKCATFVGVGKQRLSGAGVGNSHGPSTHERNVEKLADGYSAYEGDQKAAKFGSASAIAMRVYLKETDAGKPIPNEAEHRARTERTFHFHVLESQSLSKWKRHDFAKDSKYFKFRKLKLLLPAAVRTAYDRMDQIGTPVNQKRANGGGVVKFRRSTVADIALNQLAHEALRGLTQRMRRVKPTPSKRRAARIAGKGMR